MDAEEEALQFELRRQAIEKANKMMHQNQDQVKAFNSRLLKCDVQQEREAQVQLKGKKKEMEKHITKQWEELEKQQMDEHDEKLKQKLIHDYKKKMDNQSVVKQQLHDFKMNHIKRMQEEMLEGELIKKQCEEELEKEREKEARRKLKQQEVRADLLEANRRAAELAKKSLENEAAEDEKVDAFVKKKDQLDQLRKEKEIQKFKEWAEQQERQKRFNSQVEALKKAKADEEARINKQITDAEAKAATLYADQEKRKYQQKDLIEKSRQQQIQRKQQERDAEKNEEKEFSEYWKLRNAELAMTEEREREEERERNRELQRFLKIQMEEKERKAVEEFKKEQEAATRAQALLDQQEKNFYSYAEEAIKQWADQGKNIKPIILELKYHKKKIQ